MIYSLLLLSTDDQDPTPPIVTIHTSLDQLLAGFIKSVGDQLGDDEDLRNSILGEVLEGLHNVVSQMNEALSSNIEAGSFSYFHFRLLHFQVGLALRNTTLCCQ